MEGDLHGTRGLLNIAMAIFIPKDWLPWNSRLVSWEVKALSKFCLG